MSLIKRQFVNLPKNIPLYIGRQDFVVAYAMGKSVLHLGCVDAGFSQQKLDAGSYLHARLQSVTKALWGVDVGHSGLEWMRLQGWQNLYHVDIEKLETEASLFTQAFDLLVLTEVLEHLNNPGHFLEAVRPLFRPQTELLITTPNATSLGNIIANFHHQEAVHPDHNYWYSYNTLASFLHKYDYQIKQAALYSQYDYTRPWIGRFVPEPARVNMPPDRTNLSMRVEKPSNAGGLRGPKIAGWLRANIQAMFYGVVLKRWPFFADGLIAIVRPVD